MKAIVQERFGPPEVYRLVAADVPEVGADDVLVRVRAAALNPYDWHMVRGDPLVARLMGGVGLTKPKDRVAGVDAAGVVEAVGANVHELRPGDAVLGFCTGAFAEYARASADKVVPKPARLTFEQAAAVPMAAVTALQGIRDVGAVRAGQRLLVNGAAGGVGTFAVQVAAALGVEVSGVCSARNVDLVRSIGATHVIDYTTEDFTDGRTRYDVILDNVGNRSVWALRRALAPDGVVVMVGAPYGRWILATLFKLIAPGLVSRVTRRRFLNHLTDIHREDLEEMTELVESGKVKPAIDRCYPLSEVPDAIRYLETMHARAKVVITI